MPWGKFEGEYLDDIPASYLRWVLDNCRNITPALRRAIRETLQGSDRTQGGRGGPAYPPPANLPEIIRSWHRQLCLDYHPDRGGDTAVMQALNDAHDRLKKMVGLVA
jgi:hypothetical protein